MGTEPRRERWPAHLPAGALRVVRWSARYEETVTFYRGCHRAAGPGDLLRQLWPGRDHPRAAGGQVHLEIVRTGQAPYPGGGLDQLVFYLPDPAAREQMQARLAAAGARPVPQIGCWQANGGITYQDPDGREVVFAPCI